MTDLNIPTAEAFKPLEQPSRYKGAWGGRGSEGSVIELASDFASACGAYEGGGEA